MMYQFIKYLEKFFNDDKGSPSMMRALSFIIVIAPLVYMFSACRISATEAGLIVSLVTIGTGGKAAQKYIEKLKGDK